MKRNTILSVLILSLLSPSFPGGAAEAPSKTPDHYLSVTDLKKYQTVEYDKMKKDPKGFAKSDNLTFDILYYGEMEDPYPFAENLPLKLFYHLRAPRIPPRDADDDSPPPASKHMYLKYYLGGALPVVISRDKRKKILDNLQKMEQGAPIKVLGNLKKIPRNKASDSQSNYYFAVEDIYPIEDPRRKDLADEGDPNEAAADPAVASYRLINPGRISPDSGKHLGVKVKFTMQFKGKEDVSPEISGSYPNDKFIQLVSPEQKGLAGMPLVAPKSNPIVHAVVSLNNDDTIMVLGSFRKAHDGDEARMFFLIDKIEMAQPAEAAAPSAEEEARQARPAREEKGAKKDEGDIDLDLNLP